MPSVGRTENNMILIAAVNKNWGIGKSNDLLYHIPADMKFFRSKTKDNIIIVGRKTLESFPKGSPLPNRINIVLTRDSSYKANGAYVCTNIDEISKIIDDNPEKDVYVCGGAEIYSLLLPYCSSALITKVDDDADAEKFMPNLDTADSWQLSEQSETMTENGYSFSFCTYINTKYNK